MKFIKVIATKTNPPEDVEIYLSTSVILAICKNGSIILKEDQLNVLSGNLLIGPNTFLDVRLSDYSDLDDLLELLSSSKDCFNP